MAAWLGRVTVGFAVGLSGVAAADNASASATGVESGSGTAGVIAETVVYRGGEDGYFAYRIPALEVAPDGTVLAFAEARKNSLNDPGFGEQDIDLVLKRSADGGKTWSKMVVIEDPGEKWSAANPSTLVDRETGLVWLFYLQAKPGRNTYKARPRTDDNRILARTSGDNGVTWSEAVDLTKVTRDMADKNWGSSVVGPGGAIQTKGGRLVIPVWKYKPWGVFAVFSEDHGKTWTRGELVPGVDGDECQLVELGDGNLLFDIRQRKEGGRWRSVSEDGGRTWSEPWRGEHMVTPVCCAIERYPRAGVAGESPRGGAWLLWTGPKGPGRANLVMRISEDEGHTFPREQRLAEGFAAYSDLAILKDGEAGVLWEKGAEKDYDRIVFGRVSVK